MVVADGLTLVEPVAEVDVNVPGVTAMLVAPLVTQFKVLLDPALMLALLAVKDVIVGAEPFTGPGSLLVAAAPQPVRPKDNTTRKKTNAQESRLSPRSESAPKPL